MTQPIIRCLMLMICSTVFSLGVPAQSSKQPLPVRDAEKTARPYRILTSGKQITIKCTGEIKNLMVWTSAGNRIVEQKNIKSSEYSFRVTVPEKLFFIMIQLADGKTYSEKIGLVNR
jgi:hypothetical protein